MNDNVPSNSTPWNDIASIFARYDRRQFRIAMATLFPASISGLVGAASYESDMVFYWSYGVFALILIVGTLVTAFNDHARRSALRKLLGTGRWYMPDGSVGSLKNSSRGDVEFSLATGRAVFTDREIRLLAQVTLH